MNLKPFLRLPVKFAESSTPTTLKARLYTAVWFCSLASIPVMLGIFAGIYHIDRRWYRRLLREDNLVEWLTVICLVAASILAIALAFRVMKRTRNRTYTLFFLTLGLALALAALEEISWAQRIIGVDSPEFFLRNSDQQEINIHNVMQKWYSVKTKHIVGWCVLAYFVCLPLIMRIKRVRMLCGQIPVIPPLPLVCGSLIASSLLILDAPTGNEEELGEFFASLLFVFYIALAWLKQDESEPQPAG